MKTNKIRKGEKYIKEIAAADVKRQMAYNQLHHPNQQHQQGTNQPHHHHHLGIHFHHHNRGEATIQPNNNNNQQQQQAQQFVEKYKEIPNEFKDESNLISSDTSSSSSSPVCEIPVV